MTGGRAAETFCCPAYAVNDARQHRQPLEIVELTGFVSGAPLDPKGALLVRGSDVSPCMEEHSLTHGDKQTAVMDFDRCSPRVLAFGDSATAADSQGITEGR